MEYHAFKLIGKLSNLAWVVRGLETLKQGQNSLVRRLLASGSRRSAVDRLAKLVEFPGSHVCSLYYSIALAFSGLRPACLNRSACDFTALFTRELGRPGGTAPLTASSPKSDGGRILLSCTLYGHILIIWQIHERSSIHTAAHARAAGRASGAGTFAPRSQLCSRSMYR